MPKFSIIMPCYNAAETVEHTISSILMQTHFSWELICIDDGSTDGTLERLEACQTADLRVRVLTQHRQGPSIARNRGAAAAKGDILCFCDADDIWVISKLTDLETVFQDPTIDAAYGQIAFFKTPGQAETFSTVTTSALTIPMLMGENPVCTMSNFSIRRSVFERCGGLNTDMVHNEDLEWFIRLVGQGVTIAPIDRLHVWYRTSNGGLSSDLLEMAASRKRALNTAETFGFHPSRRNEAVYLRYLARRALRLESGASIARRLTLQGLIQSPKGFLSPIKRGGATALASFAAPLLPRSVQHALFSK